MLDAMWRRVIDKLFRKRAPQSFQADVLLDGVRVGVIDDQRFVDMFWYSYRVTALDPRVRDDELWQRCRFAFRDANNRLCKSAFAGGDAPFVREDRIMLRGMYFDES